MMHNYGKLTRELTQLDSDILSMLQFTQHPAIAVSLQGQFNNTQLANCAMHCINSLASDASASRNNVQAISSGLPQSSPNIMQEENSMETKEEVILMMKKSQSF